MLLKAFANTSMFFMFQFEEGNYEWAIPLIVSNFITILLMFFFTKDRSQQEIAFQQQIAKLEAHSLRAQMNTHFIFNALNGVQSVMMLQGEQMANRYLGVFSKLLRFTIEMTNSEMISLEDEEEEFVCNLVSQKNIEISKSQKESLLAHIENYS